MKLKPDSPLNSWWFGILTGFISALTVTIIIIAAHAKDFTIWEHFKYSVNPSEISPFFKTTIRARVLLSIKGGGLAVLPLFYLYLNKKMYKAVKGLMAFVFFLVIIAVYGYFIQK